MCSGKYYRANQRGDKSIYSPLRNLPNNDTKSIEATLARGSPPATPQSNLCKGRTYPTPPSPPAEEDMAAHMKLPTIKGVGDEDMERFWLFANAIWNTQNFNNDVVKTTQLDMEFEGRPLDWFMGYLTHHVDPTVAKIKDTLKQ